MKTERNRKNAPLLGSYAACGLFAAMISVVLAVGCVGMSGVDSTKPIEYVLFVQADGTWQNSGVYARRGRLVQCVARGEWGDPDGTYGPDGNKNTYKDHLGVNAPAFSLLMRLSTETNKAFLVGSETNIVADRSGYLMFRNNVSLPRRATGSMKVRLKVASDADGDGVSDYDEVCVWGTDPLNPDTNGHGFGDLDKVAGMKKSLALESDDAETDEE